MEKNKDGVKRDQFSVGCLEIDPFIFISRALGSARCPEVQNLLVLLRSMDCERGALCNGEE